MQNNWFDVFRLKRFSFIVIEINSNRERQKISQKHKGSWDKDFYTILPESFEVDSFQPGDYVKKYGVVLKSFMASEEHKILVTDQLILGAIVKGEQKDNFLNFLVKRGKKMIVLSELGTSELFEKHMDKTYVMEENHFLQKTEYENSVKVIKHRIAYVYSPFSNPVATYQKMKNDDFVR